MTTTGSSGAFLLAFLAAFDAGDRVALAEPGYPCLPQHPDARSASSRCRLPGRGRTRFQPTPSCSSSMAGTLDGLIVASPSNPDRHDAGARRARGAGRLLPRARHPPGLRRDLSRHHLWRAGATTALAFDDERDRHQQLLEILLDDRLAARLDGGAADLLRAVECLAQNLFISPPALSQHAALAAFDCRDELEGNVARYARNRDHLLASCRRPASTASRPPTAPSTSTPTSAHLTNDSEEFCRRMLAETGVATTPGVDFDRGARQRHAAHLLRRRRGRHGRGDAAPEGVAALARLPASRGFGALRARCRELGAHRQRDRDVAMLGKPLAGNPVDGIGSAGTEPVEDTVDPGRQ